MENFETIIIFKPDSSYENSLKNIQIMCQKYSNDLKINIKHIGVKKLAYDVKNYQKGYYVTIIWQGTRNNVAELESYLRTDDNVLKFINMKSDHILRKHEQETKVIDVLDIIYNLK